MRENQRFSDIKKIKKTGDIIEITESTNWGFSQQFPVKKLNDSEYLVLKTGEIKEYNKQTVRTDDLKRLRDTFANIRDTINANVTSKNVHCCRFMTVTYKENMTDTKRLYIDVQSFIRDLRNVYGRFEYITIIEPQGRGAWHLHAILIFDQTAPFMSQSKIESSIWQKGSVKITKLDDIDNLGAYLTAYLGNVPIHDLHSTEWAKYEHIEVKGKKYLKGARLSMYPAKMNIIRKSKNIKKPQVEYTSDFTKINNASKGKMTFEKEYSIQGNNQEIVKTYKKTIYKSAKTTQLLEKV